jgi:hypothetical protein
MDEKFLNSVSAFIRRCFEYADPDHPRNRTANPAPTTAANAEGDSKFAIGDSDDEEDLLDLGADEGSQGPSPAETHEAVPATKDSDTAHGRPTSPRRRSKAEVESANVALDPANPLYITLPTFRMVILADELLEQFFESSLPASFRLSDQPDPSSSSSTSSNLTTFTNLSLSRNGAAGSSMPAGLPRGQVPPGKGLRGVLDNIVSDGMRVAGEVKRRMDDAQREMEKNSINRDEEDEDEEGPGPGGYGDSDRRSVMDTDRDLLEGAEADAGVNREQLELPQENSPPIKADDLTRKSSVATERFVEFDRS